MNQDHVDPDTFSLVFERVVAAPPEVVFDAWTKPEHLAVWWDPNGVPLKRCEIDARLGGRFTLENVGGHGAFEGVYRVFERPTRLVFEAMGSVGTITFAGHGATTTMHVSIRSASREQLEQALRYGVRDNTARTLNNLVAHLQPRAA